ncbi:MAG TPA: DUF1674 domain-containing protein [Xanthobacteraceae bacterium]|nr:DUF1674 domain-containing protein [Xanthobacteraceae bacterium]
MRALFIAKSSSLQTQQGYAKLMTMPTDPPLPQPPAPEPGEEQTAKRPLPDAAQRALAEAAARRAERDSAKPNSQNEVSGRDGLDPTRYGDWEVNGLASDF